MEKKDIEVVPSILSGNFGHLADEAKRIEEAGADAIHVDIMDGHFVPNLTLGPKALAAINKATDIFLDVHIMIYNPFDFVERLVESGADRITFHLEATEEVEETINFIHKCNIEAGLAVCPDTSFSMIEKFIGKCDLLLLMTVHPGFGGQAFNPEVLEKIRLTRETCDRLHIRKNGVQDPSDQLPPLTIQVDGGINVQTAKECVEAGANSLVSGSHLFSQPDLKKAIAELKDCQAL